MRLFSYVVARDYGFAPNPFHGFCTLATCKPEIRRTAAVGDWIIGTGSKGNRLQGHLVYAMHVSEALTFDEYWSCPRFARKRPDLHGSKKVAFGDNIYHRARTGTWMQENSHHSLPSGSANPGNVSHDTRVDRVLISEHFVYFGGDAPLIPSRFRDFQGVDVCLGGRGHRCHFPEQLVEAFVAWLEDLPLCGYAGRPQDW